MHIKIHNAETGEVIEREMNQAELAQYEIDEAQREAELKVEAEAQAKRQAAEAKLVALGLDLDDLRALGL